MNDYYLTQRLQRRVFKQDDAKGLDVDFQLDYMGSSEFEWGAIPKALKELRTSAEHLAIHETVVSFGDYEERPLYFICDTRLYSEKIAAFDAWIDGGMRGKERSHFEEVFRGGEGYYDRTVAWWAIDTDAAWTLEPDLAPLLLAGLRGPAFAEASIK